MPSYRVTAEIRDVRPGRRPDEVLAAGRAAVTSRVHLDDSSIDVVRGVASVALRFTVAPSSRDEEAVTAVGVAKAAWAAIDEVAMLGGGDVHRRVKGRWVPLAGPVARLGGPP